METTPAIQKQRCAALRVATMRRTFAAGALSVAMLLGSSGCGTMARLEWTNSAYIMDRNDRTNIKLGKESPKPVFPGTGFDVRRFIAAGNLMDEGGVKNVAGAIGGFVLAIASLPLDLATDIVVLPYDASSYFSDNGDIAFWNDVVANDKLFLPESEYLSHLSACAFVHLHFLQRYWIPHPENAGEPVNLPVPTRKMRDLLDAVISIFKSEWEKRHI